MRTFYIAIIALWLLVAGAAVGQSPPRDPVQELRTTILSDAYLFAFDSGQGKGIDAALRGQKDLTRLLPAALDAAEGHDGLKTAIKAFYIAAKTYFDSALTPVPLPSYDTRRHELIPATEAIQLQAAQAKLKADVDSKANAMQLEAQLAGIDR